MAKAAQAIRALRQMRDTDKSRKLDEALTWRANDDLAEQLASEALSGLDAAMAAPPDKVACPNCGMDYALAAEMRAWKDDEGAAPPDSQDEKVYFALQVLRNVGVHTECGACMEIALTGATMHKQDCKQAPPDSDSAAFLTQRAAGG